MNNPYRDILFDKLKQQGITVLSYCDANDKAVEPLLDNRGVYQAGHMLVHKDNKYGIIYDKGNFQYEVHVPIKYDAVFENEGSKVHDFSDFFNGYDYFCRFAIKITDSLYIFDSYKDNILTTSFIASKFDKDFYYRDGKMYFIQPSSFLEKAIFSVMVERIIEYSAKLEMVMTRLGCSPLGNWVDNERTQKLLHRGKRSLQTLRSSGKIGYAIIDDKVMYPLKEIDRYLKQSYTKDG